MVPQIKEACNLGKPKLIQIENSPQDSFKKFNKVLEKLNENAENNVYERIK